MIASTDLRGPVPTAVANPARIRQFAVHDGHVDPPVIRRLKRAAPVEFLPDGAEVRSGPARILSVTRFTRTICTRGPPSSPKWAMYIATRLNALRFRTSTYPEADGPDTSMTLMVRTRDDPAQLDETVRRALRRIPEITVRYVEAIPELMAHQVALRRFSMWIAAAFGVLALSLSILGTYGLIAYEVSLREREIGIRLALGDR